MLDDQNALTVCPICKVVDTAPEFPQARGPAKRYPLSRCRRCGLVFLKDAAAETDAGVAGGESGIGPQNRFGRRIERLIRLFRMSRVRAAERLMPAGGRTLDIGCGRGHYLSMLRQRGYQVRGTELSAATAAGASPDVPVDYGEVQPGRYPDASFDLISIWHVLEHLPAPAATLDACAAALEPGGALLIAVPNYGSIQARFGGEHWLHLDLPRHRFHFTRATLGRLLAAHGFRFQRVRTGQWEMDPFGLVQTALNRMGIRHNAMFDTLRNNAADQLSPALRIAMLLVFPVGMVLATPLSLIFRLLGRGGTLIVVARAGQE